MHKPVHAEEGATNTQKHLTKLYKDNHVDVVYQHFKKNPWAPRAAAGAVLCPLVLQFRAISEAARVNCYWDFLELAAFCAVGPSEAHGLDHRNVRKRFQWWCLLCAFPDTELPLPDEPEEVHDDVPPLAPVVAAHARTERVPGRVAILDELGAGPCSAADDVLQDPRQRVAAQVASFCTSGNKPGAADPLYPDHRLVELFIVVL
jgi:hypothetical protein